MKPLEWADVNIFISNNQLNEKISHCHFCHKYHGA